MIKTLSSI